MHLLIHLFIYPSIYSLPSLYPAFSPLPVFTSCAALLKILPLSFSFFLLTITHLSFYSAGFVLLVSPICSSHSSIPFAYYPASPPFLQRSTRSTSLPSPIPLFPSPPAASAPAPAPSAPSSVPVLPPRHTHPHQKFQTELSSLPLFHHSPSRRPLSGTWFKPNIDAKRREVGVGGHADISVLHAYLIVCINPCMSGLSLGGCECAIYNVIIP